MVNLSGGSNGPSFDMATVVTPLECLVKAIGKPKPSKHQEGEFYYPTLFLIDGIDDESHKLWKNLSGDEVSQIMKGDRVQLVPVGKDSQGNDKHNIVLLSSGSQTTAPAPVPAPQEQGLTPELKRQIASYVGDMSDLYAYCLNTAQNKIGASSDSETVRCMASSLFISASRKFQLDR